MKSGKRDTLLRIVLPVTGIAVTLVASRIQKYSATDLGINWPKTTNVWVWSVLFLALGILEEALSPALGIPTPRRWGAAYSLAIKLLRVFAMVVLAPISEELLFRGLLYHVFLEKGLKAIGAILITSVAFAALHVQYGAGALHVKYGGALLFVLVNGLFYGTVRSLTGSILLTIAFHAIGNAYAAYQRF